MNIIDHKTTDETQSPCRGCPNHKNNIDKRLCLSGCLRLKAYRSGKDWTKEEHYIVPEGKGLIEDIDIEDDYDQPDSMDFEEKDELEEETDEDEFPGTTKYIPPEPSWKKTIMPKMSVANCAICGKPESHENRFLRGVCRKPCYNQWYVGKVKHPILGKFKVAPKEGFLMGKGIDAALHQQWHEPNSAETDDICLSTVRLNLELYPQILKAVEHMADKLALPVPHIVITLLGEALAARRNSG